MRSKTSVLALEWMPVSVAGGVRKSVGGFLRYVQYRDQHAEPGTGGLHAYMRYVAHRDRTSPGGRIFGRDDDQAVDRKKFVDYVVRSTKGLKSRWVRGGDGKLEDHQRAGYQMILSPEDWRGLDLRRLARVAVSQLEEDAGADGLGPWFAAEHRNTAHHHVHIVLAARRELAPGTFQTVLITRRRLQRMKDAITLEIERQRGPELERDEAAPTALRANEAPPPVPKQLLELHAAPRWRPMPSPRSSLTWRLRSSRHVPGAKLFAATLLRLRGVAARYQRQMERELEEDLAGRDRGGWSR